MQEEHHVTSILDDRERECWGCGLRLLLATYSPVFKCGWCGAITSENRKRNPDTACFSRWRCLCDRFLVSVVLLFMPFIICAGVCVVYPTVFSISYFCGIFHSTITAILSFTTISTFCLAAFRSAGGPGVITWGSYPIVGKNSLESYTFCTYCVKPKPPRAHHCRSCQMCVLDMDHHCPFIGNCVGAANHRYFIAFLISVIVSCLYVVGMTSYSAYHIWPPLELENLASAGTDATAAMRDILAFITSSVLLLSARGLVLIYLAFACLSVAVGLSALLWQQMYYIYEGKTFVSRLSVKNMEHGERSCQNILCFFGCPYWAFRLLSSSSNAAKLQGSGSKIL